MIEVLTVPARDIRPGDGVQEGTVVFAVTIGEEEVTDGRAWFVTLDLCPARIVAVEIAPGYGHLHDLDRSTVTSRRYLLDESVRVGRPAPVRPCTCEARP